MIRTGIIGYGLSATAFHIPFIECSERFTLSAISTSRTSVAQACHPEVAVFDSAAGLIDAADIDLLVITAPGAVHGELAMLGLERGRHVIVEKPLAVSSAQAMSLIEMAGRSPGLLSVFHNRRWDGDFLTVSKLVADGALGDLRLFESHFDRFRPQVRPRWREQAGAGAGTWWDLGPHLVDQALCLFGRPRAVTARILAQRPGAEVDDYFHVLLHYADTEVVLHGSSLAAGPNPRFRLHGTSGSFIKDGLDPQEGLLRLGVLPGDDGYGIESADNFGTLYDSDGSRPVETEAGRYQDYYQGIADAIDNDAPPPVSADDGLAVIRLLELAEQSQREGRTITL